MLDDGTKVFRSSKDGSNFTEDGVRVSEDVARDIQFSPGSSSREGYSAKKDAYDTAARQKAKVEVYQRDIPAPAQQRMEDADNPPLMDELEDLGDRLESQMPATVKEEFNKIEPSGCEPHRSSSSKALPAFHNRQKASSTRTFLSLCGTDVF